MIELLTGYALVLRLKVLFGIWTRIGEYLGGGVHRAVLLLVAPKSVQFEGDNECFGTPYHMCRHGFFCFLFCFRDAIVHGGERFLYVSTLINYKLIFLFPNGDRDE